jgi:hypothetical protein
MSETWVTAAVDFDPPLPAGTEFGIVPMWDLLKRLKNTGGDCHALFRYRNRKSQEICYGLGCTLDPGHEGTHEEQLNGGDYEYNTLYMSAGGTGLADVSEWTDEVELAVPSPWTAQEIALWNSVPQQEFDFNFTEENS